MFQIVLSDNHYRNAFVNPKKNHVKILVPKLHERLLYDTRKDALLVVMYCTQRPIFSTTSQDDLNYHFATKRNVSNSVVTVKCTLCFQEFPGFQTLRQHKNTQHGFAIKTAHVDPDEIINEVDDVNLKEELHSCQYFLMDSEFERARYKVFNYAVENLNENIVNETLDHCSKNLKCATKTNLASGFILKNIEDGAFRNFYAHENNTMPSRLKLVCTNDDLAKLKENLKQTDVIESCRREILNTMRRFYKLTNMTVFAVLLKDVHMGCKIAVLPELLLRNGTINFHV